MKRAIDETNRRRKIQIEYNEEHGTTPQTIVKSVRDVIEIGTHAESGKKGNSRKVLNRSENAAILTDEERNALIPVSYTHLDGFQNLWNNKIIEVFEQIGRFGCFGFMILIIPGFGFGFSSNEFFSLYLILNTVLIVAYCLIWFICFKKNSIFRALALSRCV